MFRLVTICAAIILGCVVVGGYLADDHVAQSIVDAVPTPTTHVIDANSAGDGEASAETTDQPAEEADAGGDDGASDDGDVADATPVYGDDPEDAGTDRGEQGK